MLEARFGAGARAQATVLIVEDDNDMRELIGEVLRRDGYLVLDAPSVSSALRLLALRSGRATSRLDLVLSDVYLDGPTGIELGRRLREESPRLPLIFMTAFPEPGLHRAAAGLDASILSKPFCLDALRRAVLTTIAANVKNANARDEP